MWRIARGASAPSNCCSHAPAAIATPAQPEHLTVSAAPTPTAAATEAAAAPPPPTPPPPPPPEHMISGSIISINFAWWLGLINAL